MSITASHMSQFMRSIVPSRVMPALLTTISIGPYFGDDAFHRRFAGVEVADIELHHRMPCSSWNAAAAASLLA